MPKPHEKPHKPRKPEKDGGRDLEVLGGVIVQFNYSPRGSVEGMLIRAEDRTVQVNVPPDAWPVMAHAVAIGQETRVAATAEPESPKHDEGDHPVYRLVSFNPSSEEPEEVDPASVEGIVARLNYTRHGAPNGVVLESGDFVHLKPDGMRKTGLRIGDRIAAAGKARRMLMGRLVVEGEVVNGIVIAPNWLHR